MSKARQFELDKNARAELLEEIKQYFALERDEQLGDLGAMLVFDFFVDKIAPAFYNLGVADAHKYLAERLEDLLGLQRY